MEKFTENEKPKENATRGEINRVADFIRQEGEVSIGEIAMKFNFAQAKTSFLVNAVLDLNADIKRKGRKLFFDKEVVPHPGPVEIPVEEDNPEEEAKAKWSPFNKPSQK